MTVLIRFSYWCRYSCMQHIYSVERSHNHRRGRNCSTDRSGTMQYVLCMQHVELMLPSSLLLQQEESSSLAKHRLDLFRGIPFCLAKNEPKNKTRRPQLHCAAVRRLTSGGDARTVSILGSYYFIVYFKISPSWPLRHSVGHHQYLQSWTSGRFPGDCMKLDQ